jgi:hypothetical protein
VWWDNVGMELPAVVEQQRRRFYDGGDPGEAGGVGAQAPDPNKDVAVLLDRQLVTDDAGKQREVFFLRRRIAYLDRHCGEILVPPRYEGFPTDLTSVPTLFTWLVPRTGAHLPAALLHDGLIWNPKKESKTYISTEGKEIHRVEADRVFRDGMADTGTALVRRWLVWTAVTLGTMWSRDGTSRHAAVRTYYRWIVPVTLVAIGWLGYVATADLFDRSGRWLLTFDLPWMGEGPFLWKLVTGLAGAVVIPLALGLLWGAFRRVGWIAGIGVAVLFHVTIALLAVTGLYLVVEWVAGRLSALWLGLLALVLVAAAIVLFVVGLA